MREPLSVTARWPVKLTFRVSILLALVLLGIAKVSAQDTVTGAFQGFVTDSQTGDAIEGADVTIRNEETGRV